ncbi:MAG: hypothetical protein SF066_22990 [Thermoanaerobaculia bacterium]|nr:hypothetical protein [Thermoanaerobaculia bacterium]
MPHPPNRLPRALRALTLGTLFVGLVQGCVPLSREPFYFPTEPEPLPGLAGLWREIAADPGADGTGGPVELRARADRYDAVQGFEGEPELVVFTVEGQTFLDWSIGTEGERAHTLARLRLAGDQLEVFPLADDCLEESLSNGALEAAHTIDSGDLLLTGPTTELRAILRFGLAHGCFEARPALVFTRVAPQTPRPEATP